MFGMAEHVKWVRTRSGYDGGVGVSGIRVTTRCWMVLYSYYIIVPAYVKVICTVTT